MSTHRFHPDMVEEVRQRVNIVEVISEHVVLKKRGRDYLGLCPFHNEKSPSFSVSPTKQIYYCFGCGAGGNVFKFLMEINQINFGEAVLELAQRYQIPIQTLAPEARKEYQRQISLKDQLYEILAIAAHFYHHTLLQSQGEIARHYLQEKRCLPQQSWTDFQLGYAPQGWETLYHYLIEQKQYPRTLVEEAGLIRLRQKGSGYYDQFRDRLMIPTRDNQGKVVAFGSRSLGAEEPKYLNSPETSLFNKGKTLFGLDRAKKQIQKEDRAIVVEGYFDVIALHSRGINQAVATLGTALSVEQIKLLLRYTESKQIILNFDADKAGIKATQRALQVIDPLIYSGQVNVRILNLPQGKDADEFLLASPDSVNQYQSLLAQAPLWLEWQIQQLLVNRNLKQADHFQAVARGMVDLLRHLKDPNQRFHYLQYCAEILSQGNMGVMTHQLALLQSQLPLPSQELKGLRKTAPAIILKNPQNTLLKESEFLLLLIYLHCPDQRHSIKTQLEDKDLLFSFNEHRLLWQHLDQMESSLNLACDPENHLLAAVYQSYQAESQDFKTIEPLFWLTENLQEKLHRVELQIEQAIAALEIQSWINYSNYCSQKLHELKTPQDNPQQYHYFSQEKVKAIQHLNLLNQQRHSQIPR